jgi:hypothetical protein
MKKAQMIVNQVGKEYHEAKKTNAAIAYSKQMFGVTHGQIDKPKVIQLQLIT